MRIDIETGKPVNYGPCAGTAPAIKAHTLRWIADISMATGLPVLGGRGATRWDDIIEFMMAGAAGVEMCSPVMLQGLGSVKKHLQGVEAFLERKRIDSIESIRGRALKHVLSSQQMIDDVKALYAEVDLLKCIGCHRCLDVCVYDAIQRLPKKARITRERCAGCTLCSQVCPVAAIDMHARDNDADHFKALAGEHVNLVADLFEAKQ
jgi:Pyruvate/2-oxoacid:ferredoxin oxidoreductase delta subunit